MGSEHIGWCSASAGLGSAAPLQVYRSGPKREYSTNAPASSNRPYSVWAIVSIGTGSERVSCCASQTRPPLTFPTCATQVQVLAAKRAHAASRFASERSAGDNPSPIFCRAMPWVDCSELRYHCLKYPDIDLCPEAFAEGRFPPGCSGKDFVRIDRKTTGVSARQCVCSDGWFCCCLDGSTFTGPRSTFSKTTSVCCLCFSSSECAKHSAVNRFRPSPVETSAARHLRGCVEDRQSETG